VAVETVNPIRQHFSKVKMAVQVAVQVHPVTQVQRVLVMAQQIKVLAVVQQTM
jgi:hypothetical protein